ncbi:phosphatidylinositol transfer protein beta isoform-like [Asterias rubens]|uniref:phosphatidylinositol transfer protein beta isoform-like n=1 Tax=Asterias rubens TaxID=7604 RepID=UPI0014557B69|nr:phosphatidylinositol transfer protein beta isoform-like [Asterias rubens]
MKLFCAVTVLVLASLLQDGNAVLKKEFRTLLPFSVDEFLLGYRWSIAESSILETGGGEGVQIVDDRTVDGKEEGDLHYTHRILHLETKAPPIFSGLAGGLFKVHEKSWLASSGATTQYTEKRIMGDEFEMEIRSKFIDGDDCQTEGVLSQSGSAEVIQVDFTAGIPAQQEFDPTQCASDQGPLTPGWARSGDRPQMCVYTYVEVNFGWEIMQLVEERAMGAYQAILKKFYGQMFCWADDWAGLSEKKVEKKEMDTKTELNRIRQEGEVRGQIEGVFPNYKRVVQSL